jgi:hypothetical protein
MKFDSMKFDIKKFEFGPNELVTYAHFLVVKSLALRCRSPSCRNSK